MNLSTKIRNFLNWETPPKPDKKLLPEVYPLFKPFRLPLILTILVMLVGTIGYVIIDHFSVLDAIYQTAITFTTVGFGEIAPISDTGRIFTINLIIAGFAVFSIALGILVNELNKGQIVATFKERSMLYKIARLKKHFVVCYHNDYTIEVTKQLHKDHIPFIVIDPREEIAEWAAEYKYPYFLQAEPHEEVAMLRANLSSAKGLITLSDTMADNIALIASVRLFEKEHKVSQPYYVISSAKSIKDIEMLKKLGADTVISPKKLTAQKISAIASHPEMESLLEEFLYESDNALDMQEIFIASESWVVLQKLKEIDLRDIVNTSIVGIREKDGKFISMPKGDVVVTSESRLLVIGTQQGIKRTKELLSKKVKPKELKFV